MSHLRQLITAYPLLGVTRLLFSRGRNRHTGGAFIAAEQAIGYEYAPQRAQSAVIIALDIDRSRVCPTRCLGSRAPRHTTATLRPSWSVASPKWPTATPSKSRWPPARSSFACTPSTHPNARSRGASRQPLRSRDACGRTPR